MSGLGAILNPIGLVADKIGGPAGKILDPVGAIAKKAGGPDTTAGILIDPAGALRKKKKAEQRPQQGSLLTGSKSQQQGKDLLFE